MRTANLYSLATLISLASYTWLGFNYWGSSLSRITFDFCPIKLISQYPCPACGTTRSVIELMQGHVQQGFLINPLGVLALGMMVFVPLWLLFDISSKQKTFFAAYQAIESAINTKPWLYSSLIVLILLNWFWNIQKEL